MQTQYPSENHTLKDLLEENTTVRHELVEELENNKLRCLACGHRCLIPEGRPGVCKIRFNQNGKLHVPHSYVGALNCDPIEKKPFFHAVPGSNAFSFGMLGCDYHCSYCQNWITSQALRDKDAQAPIRKMSAAEIAEAALNYGAKTVTSTYNEPLITSEWAVDVFKEAKTRGLLTSYVSNGNGTPEVIKYIRPYTDLYKIDLKSFQDKNYRKLGGTLKAVTDTIQLVQEQGFWEEIVTLVIPGMNDSEEDLRDMARFLAGVNQDIPWHVTAFHEDYKMHGNGNTQVNTLIRAAEIGKEEGLNYVYVGNLPGRAPEWENTCCPDCNTLLVERYGFRVLQNRMHGNHCPNCEKRIPGVWTGQPESISDNENVSTN